MTEMLSSGSEESQSDDSQETCHREPEKGDSPNPNSQKITFRELLKRAKEMGVGSSEYDESGELKTPTSSPSSDPSTTNIEVMTIPNRRRGTTRHASSQNSSADPQQEELE